MRWWHGNWGGGYGWSRSTPTTTTDLPAREEPRSGGGDLTGIVNLRGSWSTSASQGPWRRCSTPAIPITLAWWPNGRPTGAMPGAAELLLPDERQRLAYLEQISLELYRRLNDESQWAALAALADNLLAHETLEREEIEEIFGEWL